jgi:rRNA maturation RNase YbeY
MLKKSPKKPAKLAVKFHRRRSAPINANRLAQLAQQVWREEGASPAGAGRPPFAGKPACAGKPARIEFILVDDDFIRNLKRTFLNEDRPTDVLAFPIEDAADYFEGEVYISRDRVAENAAKFSVSFNEEMARVVIHAVLHFLGYDDRSRSEKLNMSARENYYLQKLHNHFENPSRL